MRAVAYYRVSTVKQGQSGLGLEAQRAAVQQFLRARGGELVTEFTEIESGKVDERPQLAEAMDHCLLTGSTLVIAKLDRLSRDLAFIANLKKAGVDFVAADMPDANTLTIHVMASFAQHEREAISQRTKAALAAAKARGVILGCPLGAAPLLAAGRGNGAAIKAVKTNADLYAQRLSRLVSRLLKDHPSIRKLSAALNDRGIKTRRGGQWHPKSVQNLLKRLDISTTDQADTAGATLADH